MLLPAIGLSSRTPPTAVARRARLYRPMAGSRRSNLRARQHTEQSLGQITGPALDPRGVAAEPAQRGNAPVAVNQHQTLAALLGFDRWIRNRNARDDLAALLDRTGDPLHRARLHQAGAGKAQLQAMQIKIQPRRVHAGKPSSVAAAPLSRPLFANFPGLPVWR